MGQIVNYRESGLDLIFDMTCVDREDYPLYTHNKCLLCGSHFQDIPKEDLDICVLDSALRQDISDWGDALVEIEELQDPEFYHELSDALESGVFCSMICVHSFTRPLKRFGVTVVFVNSSEEVVPFPQLISLP